MCNPLPFHLAVSPCAGLWHGRPVAVKVLQTACGAASRELESFRQEALVLEKLQHPNIVCLLAACMGE